MSVLAMFFSPARYSSLTDSNLRTKAEREVQYPSAHSSGAVLQVTGEHGGQRYASHRAVRYWRPPPQAHRQLLQRPRPETLMSLGCR